MPLTPVSAILLSNYVNLREMAWRVGHFWSLSVEEHFYLIWPCLLIVFGVMQGWRTAASLRHRPFACGAIGTLTIKSWRESSVAYLEGLGFVRTWSPTRCYGDVACFLSILDRPRDFDLHSADITRVAGLFL